MLRLSAEVRIFVVPRLCHWNSGIDRLVQIVRDRLGEDPFSGNLFCFLNRYRDQMKILVWDRNGFWVLCKRLERGRFEHIDLHTPSVEIDRVQMALLLEGLDTRTLRFRENFAQDVRIQDRGGERGSARTSRRC